MNLGVVATWFFSTNIMVSAKLNSRNSVHSKDHSRFDLIESKQA